MTRTQIKRWASFQAASRKLDVRTSAWRSECVYLAGDCRGLLRQLPNETIDCVITSPPYGQQKDYGPKGQIGFGQRTEGEYLQDISAVLFELHRVCTTGAALWVVLDTVKKSGTTLLLPWEVITRAQHAGWTLQDVVIWDKGRSLPWSHFGHFRGVFEYVLLFGKGRLKRFALTSVREVDHLSSYWVKYPERFNPSGKAPSDLWHFPIPVQGSWSRNGVRHHCPFPVPLVTRMISLTTGPGDIVLDPFAGTGSVLAAANVLGRYGLGFDLNEKFVQKFADAGYAALIAEAQGQADLLGRRRSTSHLSSLIVRLRMLKYPRTLFAELSRPDRLGKQARRYVHSFIVVGKPSRSRPTQSNGYGILGETFVSLLACEGANVANLREFVDELIRVPPLSKFGLKACVNVLESGAWQSAKFLKSLSRGRWYLYTSGTFNAYKSRLQDEKIQLILTSSKTENGSKIPTILSQIFADVPTGIVG